MEAVPWWFGRDRALPAALPRAQGSSFLQLQLLFCHLVYKLFGENNVLADSSRSFYHPLFLAALQLKLFAHLLTPSLFSYLVGPSPF